MIKIFKKMSPAVCIGKLSYNYNEHISTLNMGSYTSNSNIIKIVCNNANGGDDPHWWV
jgi:hypothetical protein